MLINLVDTANNFVEEKANMKQLFDVPIKGILFDELDRNFGIAISIRIYLTPLFLHLKISRW